MDMKVLSNIRKKYPQYDNLDDNTLASKIVAKYPQYSNVLSPSKSLLENSQSKVEELISSRPSMMASLIKDPTTLQRLKEHPLGTTLRTIMGGMELAEGVPASMGLALQRGRPQDIISDIIKTAMGKRPSELGDIFRGAGVPEPIAATGGLLASSARGMPTEELGRIIGKGVSPVFKMVSKYGTPAVAKALNIVSDIPEKDVLTVLKKPQYLNRSWLKREGTQAKQLYKTTISPYLDDVTKRVNTQSIDAMTSTGIINTSGEYTRGFTSMNASEQNKILKWIDDIDSGDISINKADSLIADIDQSLGRFYRRTEKGKPAINKTFEGLAVKLRGALSDTMKTQHPDIAPVLERYKNYKNAERIFENYDVWKPKLLNAVVASAVTTPIASMLGLPFGAAYGLGVGTTIPKVQAMGIRGISELGKNISKSQALPIQIIRNLIQKSQGL